MKNVAFMLLKLLGGGAAFALLFHFVDVTLVWATLKTANPAWVVMGVAVFLAGQVMAAERWRRVLQCVAVDLPLQSALRLNLIGTFAGNFLPGMGTGDLVKSTMLFAQYPEKKSFLVSSVIFDRLAGLAGTLTVAVTGALLAGIVLGNWMFFPIAISAAAAFMLGLSVLASGRVRAVLLRIFPRLAEGRGVAFISSLHNLLQRSALMEPVFRLSLGFQLCWVVSIWFMLCALSPHSPILPVMIAAPFSLVVAMLPVTINGLGLREGVFSFVLQLLGTDAPTAVAASMLALVPILISSILGGVLLVNGKSRDASQER